MTADAFVEVDQLCMIYGRVLYCCFPLALKDCLVPHRSTNPRASIEMTSTFEYHPLLEGHIPINHEKTPRDELPGPVAVG